MEEDKLTVPPGSGGDGIICGDGITTILCGDVPPSPQFLWVMEGLSWLPVACAQGLSHQCEHPALHHSNPCSQLERSTCGFLAAL